MKPAPFEYARPTSLEEAVGLLREHGDDAKVLAGGQSLVPMMNGRLAQPAVIVDINDVAGLGTLEANGGLRIGAVVRQRAAERSPDVGRLAPLIAEALRFVGHVGIRTRGTVAGSVAHADPAAEMPAVMLALGASMRIAGAHGERVVPAEDFFKGFFTTAVGADELLARIDVPGAPADARSAFVEVSRRHGDFAIAGAAVAFQDSSGRAGGVRIALSGVADRPVLAGRAQAFLEGEDPGDAATRAEVARLAAADLEPPSDIHAPGSYRRQVAAVLVERALTQAVERGGSQHVSSD
jgi:carbon-monoxide dehydrogenase medium subunit